VEIHFFAYPWTEFIAQCVANRRKGFDYMTELRFNTKAYGRIKGGITDIDTSIELYPGYIHTLATNWITAKSLHATIVDRLGNREVITITDIDFKNNKLTASRGVSARSWTDGCVISQRITEDDASQFIQKEAFREIAYNPNGVLTAKYVGEKVFQNGAYDFQKRWWKNITGTSWQLIAGSPYDIDLISSGTDENLTAVIYDNSGLAIAASENGRILTSIDGDFKEWTDEGYKLPIPTPDPSPARLIYELFGGSTFFRAYQWLYIEYSSDGITWNQDAGSGRLTSLHIVNDVIIASDYWNDGSTLWDAQILVGTYNGSPRIIFKFKTYSLIQDLSSYSTSSPTGLAFTPDGHIVIVFDDGTLAITTIANPQIIDGSGNLDPSSPFALNVVNVFTKGFNHLISNGNDLIAVGESGNIRHASSSYDQASSWIDDSVDEVYNFNRINYNSVQDLYCIVGDHSLIYVSDDGGSTWTKKINSETVNLNDVFVTSSLIVVVGDSGKILLTI